MVQTVRAYLDKAGDWVWPAAIFNKIIIARRTANSYDSRLQYFLASLPPHNVLLGRP